ncbi:hypothetical protein Mhun_1552 [Methanospirillum hungatei JF-1]|uniref:Uncharacterized protein n=2 Tax=Methanospirillum hungatei TaxID=2203 RepID=Q2FNS6_METHJ|nr:hypothetical protein Mhun_1552 [Methanospirillum hungatei JF-1]
MRMNKKISVDQEITGLPGVKIGDFWSWAYSDLLSNTVRPLFAEFLVGYALDVTESPRVEWNYIDFCYKGLKIEVKSSGYLQSWNMEKPSLIKFDIAKKIPWDASTNKYGDHEVRSADLYIFCVLTEKNPDNVCVFDLAQWEFYVFRTSDINKHFRDQKSITLSRLQQYSQPIAFEDVKKRVDEMVELL